MNTLLEQQIQAAIPGGIQSLPDTIQLLLHSIHCTYESAGLGAPILVAAENSSTSQQLEHIPAHSIAPPVSTSPCQTIMRNILDALEILGATEYRSTDSLSSSLFDVAEASTLFKFHIQQNNNAQIHRIESEERLRSIIRHAPIALFSYDRDGTITFFDGRGIECLGIDSAERLGRNIFDVYADRPEILDPILQAYAGKEIHVQVCLQESVFDSYYVPLFDEQHEVTSVIGIAINVTEKHHSERALRLSETRFRTLIEKSSDLIIIMNNEGIIEYLSPSATELTGYSQEELIGTALLASVHDYSHDDVRTVLSSLQSVPGSQQSIGYWFHHADGNWRYHSATIRNLLEEETICGFLLNARDVSDEHRLEIERNTLIDELEKTNTHMEEKMREMTQLHSELTTAHEAILNQNDRLMQQAAQIEDTNMALETRTLELVETVAALQQQKNEAEETLQQLRDTQTQLVHSEKMNIIGNMVAGVMHEINNPNAAISAATEEACSMLRQLHTYFLSLIPEEDKNIPEVEEFTQRTQAMLKNFDVIGTASDRVRTIVTNFRSFTRHQEASYKQERLTNLIESTTILLRYQFKYIGVEMHVHTEDDSVIGNLGELNQVFLNLMVNAAQADAKHLTIDIEERDALLYIHLRDDGKGIDPDHIERIFTSGFSTKGENNSGLGLAITKEILDRHHATISVHSLPGEGTTFSIGFRRDILLPT